MTKLNKLKVSDIAEELDCYFQRAEPCCLYKVNTTRNTWQSSFYRKYYDSIGIFTSEESAQEYCNNNRVNGTKFIVRQWPALRLYSKKVSFFVTQDISEPLSALQPNEFLFEETFNKGKKQPIYSCSFKQIVSTISKLNMYTKGIENHYKIYISNNVSVEKLSFDNLSMKVSKSVGSTKPLVWTEYSSQISRVGVNSFYRYLVPKKR